MPWLNSSLTPSERFANAKLEDLILGWLMGDAFPPCKYVQGYRANLFEAMWHVP